MSEDDDNENNVIPFVKSQNESPMDQVEYTDKGFSDETVEFKLYPDSEFWNMVYPDGMEIEDINNELIDFEFLLENVPKVYDNITGGKLSKVNCDADTVISEFNDNVTNIVDDSIEEEIRSLIKCVEWSLEVNYYQQDGLAVLSLIKDWYKDRTGEEYKDE